MTIPATELYFMLWFFFYYWANISVKINKINGKII